MYKIQSYSVLPAMGIETENEHNKTGTFEELEKYLLLNGYHMGAWHNYFYKVFLGGNVDQVEIVKV